MKEKILKYICLRELNRPFRLAVFSFWFVLVISLAFFIFHIPTALDPKIDTEKTISISQTLTADNPIDFSFVSEKNNLQRIFLYVTTNIKATPKNSPRIIISIYDKNNSLVFTQNKKVAYLKNKDFYSIVFPKKLSDSKNQTYSLKISMENPLKDENQIEFWQYSNGEIVKQLEYASTFWQTIGQNWFLFIPSLFLIFFLLFLFISNLIKTDWICLSHKQLFIFILIPFLFLNSIFYVFWVNHMAPIDEQSHFEVIQTIGKDFSLPALYSHNGIKGTREAFQPPLYYLVSSPFVMFLKKSDWQKTILQIWGAIQYTILICLSFLILQRLTKKFDILKQQPVFLFFVFFCALAPALIVRSICISNGTFACIFIALQILFLLKYLEEEKSKKNLFILAVVSGLSLLTRFTNFYALPAVMLTVFIKEHFNLKPVLKFLAIVLLILVPWFAWNYHHYKALTPNKMAMEDQREVVNPENKIFGLNFIKSNSFLMINTIFASEEYGSTDNFWAKNTIQIFSYLIIAAILFGLFFIVKNTSTAFDWQSKNFLILIFVLLAILNIFQQYAVVLLDNWPVLLGRYLHGNLFSFAILIILFLSFVAKKTKIKSFIFLFLSLCLILLNSLYLINIIQNFDL